MTDTREFYPNISTEQWETVSKVFSKKELSIISNSVFDMKETLDSDSDLHNDYANVIYKLSCI